jgi:outer membrane receptor protein involved in Fe transport
MQRCRSVLITSRVRHVLWLAICAPCAGALAAEPVRAGDSQPLAQATSSGTLRPVASVGAGVISYPASFFAEFQPTTAFDMVKRLPGFTFAAGDTEVRGFAAALGNVLIDGKRPVSKAVLLEDILRRIPVSSVAAIEVIRGGAPGINMQGQSVVANVVRAAGDMSTHSAELTSMFAADHDPGVGLRLETTRSLERLALNGALNYKDEQQYGNTGTGALLRRDSNGTLLEASNFETDWSQRSFQANGSAEYQIEAGSLRFNLGGTSQDTTQLDILSPRPGVPLTSDGRVVTAIRLDQGEAGIDYEQLWSDALTGRLLLLQTLERKTISADAISPQTLQSSEDDAFRGESILRSSATYRSSPTLTIEGGLEAAYNFLDVDAALRRNGAPVPLPSGKVKVEERRGEAFVDARWKLSPRLSSDVGIRYEVSTISQSGDHDARRTLSYPKPRAMFRLDLDDGLQLRSRIERTVSQLEFRDFASQASLDAGTISGGNAELRPETAWELEGAIEKRFWGRGAVVLTYTHSIVSDVVDLVPVAGFDTAGNIGDGTREQIAMSLSLPLERMGIDGTLLRINGTWRWSQVDDPVAGVSRSISKDPPVGGDVLLTREFPALASTLSLENSSSKRETAYRLGEVRTDHWDHFLRLYWDWTPRADTVVRLMFNNFTGRPKSRWRTVYDGSRGSGRIAYHEDRHIDALRFVQLQVRKTF